MNNNNRSWGGRGPGGMEQQIILWIADFKKWVYSHERFSWITFFLAVIPSPITSFVAFFLAVLQLHLCAKGKIPKAETKILLMSIMLSLINFMFSIWAIKQLVNYGSSYWQIINPLWFFNWIHSQLFSGGNII